MLPVLILPFKFVFRKRNIYKMSIQKLISIIHKSKMLNRFASANGKLCFEVLKTFSVPENHLPRWGKSPSKVVRPYRVYSECNDSKLPGIGFQRPSLANLSAYERTAGSIACWKRYKSVNYQAATE